MKFVLIKKRTLFKATILGMALLGVLLGVHFSGAAAVFNNTSVRNHPIYSVATQEQKVAISFDVAYGARHTQSILDVLATHEVKATFFITGAWAERNVEEMQAVIKSERVEVGSLSNTHPHMTRLTNRQMQTELSSSLEALQAVVGARPNLFRAPFGEYSNSLLSTAGSLNLTTIQWSVDGLDHQNLSSYDITNRVLAQSSAGSIIRLSGDGQHTAGALGAIIQGLQNRNLTIVPVGQLIFTDNYTIDHSGKQQKVG